MAATVSIPADIQHDLGQVCGQSTGSAKARLCLVRRGNALSGIYKLYNTVIITPFRKKKKERR